MPRPDLRPDRGPTPGVSGSMPTARNGAGGWEAAAAAGALLLLLTCAPGARAQEWIYSVRPGDTLWDLTETHLTSMRYWPRLQQLNAVKDPWKLPPGTRLRIPIAWLKVQPASAQVVATQGSAQAVLAATGETVAVAAGLRLSAGDTIQTGPEASVTLEFGDGSRLLVEPESRLVLDELRAYGNSGMVDTRLRLQRGRTESRVTPRPAPGVPRYEISTPAAVTGVRGTRYRVSAKADQEASNTEVLGGRVGVTGAGATRLVPAGYGVVTEAGKAPPAPTRLLAAPDLSGLSAVLERVPISLAIPVVRGAVAYRVQIARDEGFSTLLFDRTFLDPRVRGPDLPDGDYVLRARGVDALGLEGLDAYRRLTVNARPEPPFLVSPGHDTAVLERVPIFNWAQPEGAVAYRFQLADNERFVAPIIDLAEHRETSLTPAEPLAPGLYFWRVATRARSGEEGPFSDPQRFKQPPPAPAAQAPVLAETEVAFRWGAAAPGERYEFQLARDPDFEERVVDAAVSEPQIRIARPESGIYYLRIRAVDPDGDRGPYGAPQRIDLPPRSYWPLAVFGVLLMLAP